ncbi:MAG: PRC-barrel domain-containing protein [Armatimonadetes bacterium]|nr:PRC-barrel domain-containing protein [Armatimonadota bacterium]
MADIETFNTQTKSGAPAILELLSEIEKRDKANKGEPQSGSVAGSTLGDPRGFAVLNTTGHHVGKVADLYVDPHTREPYFALLSLGGHALGIGNRQVLVGYNDLEVVGDKQVKVHVAVQQAL